MSQDLQHIKQLLDQSDGYLSYEMMERYIAGTLSYQEQHYVEKELLANPLLADAMEGLKASRSNIARVGIDEVEAMLDRMTDQEKVVKKIPYLKLSGIAAAALVIVVGSVVLFNQTANMQSESLAKAEPTEEETSTREDKKEVKGEVSSTHEWVTHQESSSDVAITEQKVDVLEEDAEEEPESEALFEEITIKEEEVMEKPAPVSQDTIQMDMVAIRSVSGYTTDDTIEELKKIEVEENVAVVAATTETLLVNEMLAYNQLPALKQPSKNKAKAPAYGKDSYNYKYMDEEGRSAQDKKNIGKSANFYEEAITAYNNGSYKESASKFDMVLSADPLNSEAQMYGGVSHLKKGNTSRAEELLSDATKSSLYFEHATWYLAATYLKEGKKKKAKKTLKDLDKSAIYADKAKAIADQL